MTQYVTPVHALPLLASGQAQKEISHNEALILIDALLGGVIENALLSEPPDAPAPGALWLVAEGASGAWAGESGRLALWTQGGWRFVSPRIGCRFFDKSRHIILCLYEYGWNTPISLNLPSGGGVIDAEARATLANIKDILISLGLAVP